MKRYYALEVENRVADIDIYGDITSWPWVESDVSAYNLSAKLAQLDVDEINVNINSYGGEVAEGLAIFNALKRHKAKVNTRCDGFACSIASVIFMAGDKRVMNDASLLMIHHAWTYASGDANALRKQAAQLMDEETFIDSDAAIEMGFATDVANTESDKPAQCARALIYQALTDDEKPSKPTDDPGIEIEDPEDEDPKESETDDEDKKDDSASDDDSGSDESEESEEDSHDTEDDEEDESESDSNDLDGKQPDDDSKDSDDEEDEVSKQYANFFKMIN